MNNIQKLVIGGFCAVAVVVGFFVRQLADTLLTVFRVSLPVDWPLSPPDILGIVVGVVMFVVLKKSQKVNQFTTEVFVELSKVTWPPKKETLLSAVVVSVMVAICALILFGFDTLWGTVVKLLYN